VYSGANTYALTITAANTSLTGNKYRCIVSGVCTPSVISNIDTLIVNDSLSFIAQPAGITICSGNNTSFSVGVSGTIQSYQWQVNTGTGFINLVNGSVYSGVSTGSLIVTAATTAMNGYQYRCIVSGPCTSNLSSNTATFNVNPVPSASMYASGPLIFCPGDSVSLIANAGLGLTYQWQLNSNNITGANNIIYEASSPGNYTVVVTNSNNCSATSSSIVVSNYAAPIANISPSVPTTICSNDSIIFHVGTGTNYTYQWELNNNSIVGATDSVFTTHIGGSYSVSVTNNYGCISTSSATSVTVNYVPTPPVFNLMGFTTFCNGDSLLLGTNSNYTSYQWQRNGVNIPGAITNDYLTHIGGIFRVIITTSLCTSSSAPVNVVVYPLPFDSLILNGPPVICSGMGNYLLSAFSVTGQTYQWYKYGLIIYGATGAQYAATNPGSYNVEISSAQGCSIFTASVNVSTAVSPVPLINEQGLTLQTGTYVTYQWYLNNALIPGATNSSYPISQNGAYTVSVTDSNGCSGMSVKYVISNVGVSNVSTIAGDISVYPNPATSIVYFKAPLKINVSILDLRSKIILQKRKCKIY